jgi:malonyl CoA-acyl carrier protein transacylase
VRVVRTRGRLMQEAVPAGRGRMLAVIGTDLDAEAIARTIADLAVDVANDNSREQVVVSGLADDVRAAETRLAPMARRLVALDVSAPFHSRLMAGIEPAFAVVLREAAGGVLDARRAAAVTANVSGRFHDPDPEAVLERLVRQVSGTVRWRSNMDTLRSAGERVLEVGPGAPLRGFFRTLGVAVEAITSVRALTRLGAQAVA